MLQGQLVGDTVHATVFLRGVYIAEFADVRCAELCGLGKTAAVLLLYSVVCRGVGIAVKSRLAHSLFGLTAQHPATSRSSAPLAAASLCCTCNTVDASPAQQMLVTCVHALFGFVQSTEVDQQHPFCHVTIRHCILFCLCTVSGFAGSLMANCCQVSLADMNINVFAEWCRGYAC